MQFNPHRENSRDSLDDLNSYIEAQDPPRLTGTEHMGLHNGEWVVPGGSLTPDGWADDPETVYLEQKIGLERKVNLPMDRDDYDESDVAEILRTFPKTRPAERLLPVLGWFYAAPLRPHIQQIEREFNVLNITGETGSGKTTTLRYLVRCFGLEDKPFGLNGTPFTFMTTMGATNAIPVWYDEYKPGDYEQWRVNNSHAKLRLAATGGVDQRGNSDKSTDEYNLQAPLVISGEEQIRPPAERRRSIMVSFKKATTAEGSKYVRAYQEIAGEAHIKGDELVIHDDYPQPDEHALAYYRYITSLDHETVRELRNEAKLAVAEYRQQWDAEEDLGDMERQALQTVLFGWATYVDFAERHGVARDQLPGDDAMDAALRQIASAVESTKSHTDQFLELMARAAGRDVLERDKDYGIVREGSEREELRFHMGKCYDAISGYIRNHDLTEDLFSNAKDYRKRFKELYEDEDDRLVVSYRQKTPGVGDCIGVMTRIAADRLDFDRSAFRIATADAGDATAITNLPAGGYVTIEAEVADLETPAPTGDPGASGALRDETGVVDFVAWKDLAGFDTQLEKGGTYRISDALVSKHNNAPQIILNPDVATIEAIQSGVGHTPGDDPGEKEELEAASDGGEIEGATGTLAEYLRLNHERNDVVKRGGLAGGSGLSPEKADHAIDRLLERGRLQRADDDDTFLVVE